MTSAIMLAYENIANVQQMDPVVESRPVRKRNGLVGRIESRAQELQICPKGKISLIEDNSHGNAGRPSITLPGGGSIEPKIDIGKTT